MRADAPYGGSEQVAAYHQHINVYQQPLNMANNSGAAAPMASTLHIVPTLSSRILAPPTTSAFLRIARRATEFSEKVADGVTPPVTDAETDCRFRFESVLVMVIFYVCRLIDREPKLLQRPEAFVLERDHSL